MPNLILREAFDFGDIAIVGGKDGRLKEITQRNAAAKALLSGFDYSLGKNSVASAMICRNRDSFKDPWAAMVDAKNCVAVVCACFGWERSIAQSHNFTVRYTDFFDFYPRWPSADGKGTVYQGEARTVHASDATGFIGTTHAYLSVTSFTQPILNLALLNEVTKVWRRIHVAERPLRDDQRLMRSLSVAYEACRVPQAMENDVYDHGKHTSLWVSALETLAHPGTRVGLREVLDLIGKRELNDPRLNRKARMKHGKKSISLNAAQRLYFHLYRARNSFLHGNRLTVRSFMPKCLGKGIRLLDTAPLVFLAALEASLPDAIDRITTDHPENVASIMRYNSLENSFSRALGKPDDLD